MRSGPHVGDVQYCSNDVEAAPLATIFSLYLLGIHLILYSGLLYFILLSLPCALIASVSQLSLPILCSSLSLALFLSRASFRRSESANEKNEETFSSFSLNSWKTPKMDREQYEIWFLFRRMEIASHESNVSSSRNIACIESIGISGISNYPCALAIESAWTCNARIVRRLFRQFRPIKLFSTYVTGAFP